MNSKQILGLILMFPCLLTLLVQTIINIIDILNNREYGTKVLLLFIILAFIGMIIIAINE